MASIALLRQAYRTQPRSIAIKMSATQQRSNLSTYLVSPQELNEALKKKTTPATIPLCASWFLPNDPEKRTGLEVFRQGHIPGARFFDLDKVSDTSSPYPHMLPSAEVFAKAISELGIHREDSVVVYDSAELGIFSAPRVAWTLKVFGHPSVHILNNFKLWKEQGLPIEEGDQEDIVASAYPTPELDATKVVAFEEVKDLAKGHKVPGHGKAQILDARSLGRWKGTDPEPRPGLSSGHMPGSISVPVTDLLDPKSKTLLSADKLREVFKSKGVDSNKPIVSSCGTGVTAAVIDAALTEAGYHKDLKRVYDGSWTEWAQRVDSIEADELIVKSET